MALTKRAFRVRTNFSETVFGKKSLGFQVDVTECDAFKNAAGLKKMLVSLFLKKMVFTTGTKLTRISQATLQTDSALIIF